MSAFADLYVHCWQCFRLRTTVPQSICAMEFIRYDLMLFGVTYYGRPGRVTVLYTKCVACG